MAERPVSAGVRASGAQAAALGEPRTRIDGLLKVCGLAEYPGDVALPGMAHAALVVSPIARGQITAIHRTTAAGMPGVLLILTHEDVGEAIAPVKHLMEGGWANSSWRPLASPEVHYAGQIVAMVLGETREAAQAGAAAMRFTFAGQSPVASLDDPRAEPQWLTKVDPEHDDRDVGDLAAAFASAPAVIDARYVTPIQHHNPIELPSTTCLWEGDRLTV